MTSRARLMIETVLIAVLCVPGLVSAKGFVQPNQTIETEIIAMDLVSANPFGAGLIRLTVDGRIGFETLGEIDHYPYDSFPAESFFDVHYRIEIDDFGGGPISMVLGAGESPERMNGTAELVPFEPNTQFTPPAPGPLNLEQEGGPLTGTIAGILLDMGILDNTAPDFLRDWMIDSFFDVTFDIALEIKGGGVATLNFVGLASMRRDITVPIPTLSQWSLLLLAALLVGSGFVMRRRSARTAV